MRRENNFAFFLVFFGITLGLILFGKLGLFNLVLSGASTLSFKAGSVLHFKNFSQGPPATLTQENALLRQQLVNQQKLKEDNKALSDQFSTSNPSPQSLLEAKVVGSPGFIPGVSNPDYLVINKGSADGINLGSAVVYQNNLVGRIVGVSTHYSKVQLAINSDSFTARVEGERQILGVARGIGDSLSLENVLLSENLKKGDLVLTKGDQNEKGEGIPPDLVVGKIISIEKKSSELFQKAEIKSFLDFKNLSTVFVIK